MSGYNARTSSTSCVPMSTALRFDVGETPPPDTVAFPSVVETSGMIPAGLGHPKILTKQCDTFLSQQRSVSESDCVLLTTDGDDAV